MPIPNVYLTSNTMLGSHVVRAQFSPSQLSITGSVMRNTGNMYYYYNTRLTASFPGQPG